jgi:hypothetical protein
MLLGDACTLMYPPGTAFSTDTEARVRAGSPSRCAIHPVPPTWLAPTRPAGVARLAFHRVPTTASWGLISTARPPPPQATRPRVQTAIPAAVENAMLSPVTKVILPR